MSEPVEPEVVEAVPVGTGSNFERAAAGAGTFLVVRGILFIILGALMLVNPVATITIAIMVMGCYILMEGIFMLRAAYRMTPPGAHPFGCSGIFMVLLGLVALFSPWWLGEMAILFLGVWQLVSGIQCLMFPGTRTPGTLLSGIFSVLTGLFFLSTPVFGLAALGVLIAIPFFLSGMAMLTGGLSLRKLRN